MLSVEMISSLLILLCGVVVGWLAMLGFQAITQMSDEKIGWISLVCGVAGAVMAVSTLTGCGSTRKLVESLPPGTSFQSSQTGVQFSPELASPINFGNSFVALQLPPPDGGVAINRSNIRASLAGVENTGTVTIGPVGEEIQKAGGPAALEALLTPRVGPQARIPTEGTNDSDSTQAE